MSQRAAQLAREGLLPLREFGAEYREELVAECLPARLAWLELCKQFPDAGKRIHVHLDHAGITLDDWVDNVRSDADRPVLAELQFGRLLNASDDDEPTPRPDKIIPAWLRLLAAAAMSDDATRPWRAYAAGVDGMVEMSAPEPDEARQTLARLIKCWLDGMSRPLPVGCRTATAYLGGGDDPEADARLAYEGSWGAHGEVDYEPCLSRLWPDFDALTANHDWADCAEKLYGELWAWLQHPDFIRVTRFEPASSQQEAA
jgi:exodeoxyribonuclease V gamma subunit